MIFVTLGSSKIAPMLDFAREVDRIAPHFDEKIIIQYGVTEYDFKNVEGIAYLDSNEMKELLEKANIVVSHGGWGNLSTCINMGKRLVAVPRKLGVEVNHDQLQLVKKLESLGCLIAVEDIGNLENAIRKAVLMDFNPLPRGNALPLIEEALHDWKV